MNHSFPKRDLRMIVARPMHADEPDLLYGFESEPLRIVDDTGQLLALILAPTEGWSHDNLEAADLPKTGHAWEAYLGDQWVGSSEV